MQTIIGIVICLVVIIIFSIGYMNSHYDGFESGSVKTTVQATTTSAPKSGVSASPSGEIPLTTVVENANKAAVAKETIIGLSQNKNQYAELINHLLDYYDNKIIYEISNAKQDANGDYDLNHIVEMRNIKQTLLDSLEYIN